MTPTEVLVAAKDMYNASNDPYFSDNQIYNWIWQGCHEFARKAWLIESIFNQSTIVSTQAYSYPTNVIAIKRVTVYGRKLKRITMRDDDAITLSNNAVTTQGYPTYYTDFNYTMYFRPIPDGVYAIEIWAYLDAAPITSTSTTLEIPTLFHFDLVDYVLFRMFSKDKSIEMAQMHQSLWLQHVKDAIEYKNRLKRTDSFATVQSEDTLPVTILGEA